MATKFHPRHVVRLHPAHAVLIASTLPLYLGAMLSDLAYGSTYEIQWTNFASWLIVGALVFNAAALPWAAVDMFRAGPRWRRRSMLYLLLSLVTFIAGFINALVHGRDGWATMPEGLILSIIVTILAIATIWVGFAGSRAGETQ